MRRSISREQFLNTGEVYADTLQEAFCQYRHAMLRAHDKNHMKEFLTGLAKESVEVYGDFYYARLNAEEKETFVSGLTESERAILQTFEIKNGQVFYRLDSEAMEFLFELTARNWLFSTFYFIGNDAMMWGNYNLEFQIFCNSKVALDNHLALAKKCRLEIL